MPIFVLINLLAIALFTASVRSYFKLKAYYTSSDESDRPSLHFVDVLFNERLKSEPEARGIQKRAIGLFCLSLLMVHISRFFYTGSVE